MLREVHAAARAGNDAQYTMAPECDCQLLEPGCNNTIP